MPSYTVQQGDCLYSIAEDNGFDWQTLWNHPQNAALKQLRKNPNVLLAGDTVFIPDLQTDGMEKPTGAAHRFVVNRNTAQLRLQLIDRNHKPRPNLTYSLSIDGDLRNGTSDSSGFISQPMPANARKAQLTVVEDGIPESYPLNLGHVDPITEPSGVQQRLVNLGYSFGTLKLKEVLQSFQRKYKLPETGEADAATLDKIKAIHGC